MAQSANGSFGELRLDGVRRAFNGVAALDDLTLTIRQGEFIALLGPSGCGKSTALNCLAGLLPLTGGSIWIDDRRIDELPPERRGFGMVFQNYALFPHMSVRKNIGFGLAMRNVPKAEIAQRVEAALQLVQLTGHADKLPGQLSGGQQQRVAIARAIVVQPPLVLMDEPLSNLDAKLRLEMRHEIRRIHNELGRATVYVTHDQDEALSMADRIVVLQDGVVQQIGKPEELYRRPANLDVARFMGFRNIVALPVTGASGQTVEVSVGGHTLSAISMEPLTVGATAAIAFRPDDVLTGNQGGNAVAGSVETADYCGHDYAVDLVTEGGLRLHVRSPDRVVAGDKVTVSISPEAVLAFKPDARLSGNGARA